jgi:hypothetical protein
MVRNNYTQKHKKEKGTKGKKGKKGTKKNNSKQANCAPKNSLDYTCYSSKSLNKLKSLWNKKHQENKIRTNNSKKIWNKLKKNLSKTCKSERCWLTQEFISNDLDNELKNNTFAPNAPSTWKKNPNEWLNSNDINKVMKQYEEAYPEFDFIGPSPIDFNNKKLFGQCVWNELCKFNLKSYIKKGKSKIGIIFNTDPHYLGGAHWICMFIDIKKKYLFYFDSNADATPQEIIKFTHTIRDQAAALGIKLKYFKNTTEHQKSDTECGMYVLYIITELVKGKKNPDSFEKRVPDKNMVALRKILFN